MSSAKRRSLLKVIILGDSGQVPRRFRLWLLWLLLGVCLQAQRGGRWLLIASGRC